MYCRNVCLQSGLTMPAGGWVVNLGADRGLFTVWAAASGARVVAVDAQQGFAPLQIRSLALHNGVADRVHIEISVASGSATSGARVGIAADDRRSAAASHGAGPGDVALPQIISRYGIDRIGLMKIDIEGGEYALL